jgi:hypothetical protein
MERRERKRLVGWLARWSVGWFGWLLMGCLFDWLVVVVVGGVTDGTQLFPCVCGEFVITT